MKGRFVLDPSKLDLNGGFLCLSSHWRPNPNDPNPDMPGQKLSMSSYIPVRADDACLCGSGKTFNSCCQQKNYWHPVCLNPDGKSYSLMDLQSEKFHPVDGTTLREQLMNDIRLYCVEDGIKRSFWIYWGDPALEDQYGILCFGDIELKQNRTLLITAMSDLRMQILLNLVREIAGEQLGSPKIIHDKIQLFDKRFYGSQPRRGK
jgi:hypothetical protein